MIEHKGVHGGLQFALVAVALAVAMSSFYLAPRGSSGGSSGSALGGPGSGTQSGQASGDGSGALTDNGNVAGGDTSGGGGSAGGSVGLAGGGSAGARAAAASGRAGGGGSGPAPNANISCPGKNGGSTDVGVDGGNVHLAATVVQSGIGRSFLGPVENGMFAVQQKTNRGGGVCGRQIQLKLQDDGWDAQRGKQYIDNFIASNQYLALAVVPSSEGLNAASQAKDLDNAQDPVTGTTGIPVVGTDGMLNSQYTDPLIWPVAASTATSMRIMGHDARRRGAQSFAIVYNSSYKFGIEGKDAFLTQLKKDGGSISGNCVVGLTAGQQSYKDQVNSFNSSCGTVDFVALLLEPQTAESWLQDNPYHGIRGDGSGQGMGGPQPLFDYNFGNACGQICANMQIWTSFYPPIYPYDQQAPVQAFKRDLCAVDSNCNVDADSAFTEGGYVGFELLVDALNKASKAALTRRTLVQALDSETLNTGLSAPLTFSGGHHYANESMIAFKDNYGQSFSGFTIINGSQQNDPCPGC